MQGYQLFSNNAIFFLPSFRTQTDIVLLLNKLILLSLIDP